MRSDQHPDGGCDPGQPGEGGDLPVARLWTGYDEAEKLHVEAVYRNPVAKGEESKAQDMIARLF